MLARGPTVTPCFRVAAFLLLLLGPCLSFLLPPAPRVQQLQPPVTALRPAAAAVDTRKAVVTYTPTPLTTDYNIKPSTPAERREASQPIDEIYGLKIVLIGKPCSGKGTQAPLMARKYRMIHLSTGGILRSEIQAGTELGLQVQDMMARGELLDDEIMLQLVKKRVAEKDCKENGWILDGFPRTVPQAMMMAREGIIPDMVIELARPDELVKEWCLGRAHDAATGVIYHPKFNPPPPEVLPRLVWRMDDTLQTLEHRLDLYNIRTRPVLELYPPGLVVKVNTARNDVEVFREVSSHIARFAKRLKAVGKIKPQPIKGGIFDREAFDVPAPRSTDGSPIGRVSLRTVVARCNRYDRRALVPVYVGQGYDLMVGYASTDLASELLLLNQGLKVETHADYIRLAPTAMDAYQRTRQVTDVVMAMVANGVIPAQEITHQLQDVRNLLRPSFTSRPIMSMERAAMIRFGVPSFGVHVNGLVRPDPTSKARWPKVWIAKRSKIKTTYPGLWDVLATGAQRSGMTFRENAIQECESEASVPVPLLEERLRSVGQISYRYQTSRGLSTKIVNLFDIELPRDFTPRNRDGEVESYQLMGLEEVLESIQADLSAWKPNSALTILELCMRQGLVNVDHPDYVELNHMLRGAFMATDRTNHNLLEP